MAQPLTTRVKAWTRPSTTSPLPRWPACQALIWIRAGLNLRYATQSCLYIIQVLDHDLMARGDRPFVGIPVK